MNFQPFGVFVQASRNTSLRLRGWPLISASITARRVTSAVSPARRTLRSLQAALLYFVFPERSEASHVDLAHFNTGHHFEQHTDNVVRRPAASRCHVDLARIGYGIGDELWEGLGWHRWINLHDEAEGGESADWRDVADEIEIQSVIERCVDGVR